MILNDTITNDVDFIICTNNELWFSECERYIRKLCIPVGIHIHVIPVWNARNMCNGYNIGMRQSKAKYKVYLHHDTFIINPDFIADILRIFKSDEKIGLLGLVGADEIKRQKIAWGDWEYGKTLGCNGLSEKCINFGSIEGLYQQTDCVDGMLIATQYDIPWREDIFTKWDLYDRSICIEFRRQGYMVVVPKQEKPWCIHDCGPSGLLNWKQEMILFVNTYTEYFSAETIGNSVTEEIYEHMLEQTVAYTKDAEVAFHEGDYNAVAGIINTVIKQRLMISKRMMEMYNLLTIAMSCQTNLFFQSNDTLETMTIKLTKARFLLRRLYYGLELDEAECSFLQQLSTDEKAFVIKTGLTFSASQTR